jgi:bifunctional polynucleotide phosphatase/kinase
MIDCIPIALASTEWQISCLGRVHICRFLGGGKTSQLIAAFDFDGTLVTPKSGNKYPIDANDWKLIDKSLPKRIEKLIDNGYRFVVISNQLGISQGRMKLDDIKHRFESALTAIGFPCLVLIAAFDDIYRKPRPGLWQLLNNESIGLTIDTANSFYVGDAAGRKKQLNGKSDHSSVDLLFSANSNLPFLTPERFTSDIKPKTWDSSKSNYSSFTISSFRPSKSDNTFIATKIGSNQQFKDINQLLSSYSGKLHVIIFCGLPASGKSSFYSNHLERLGYSYVSRDQLKTMDKCYKRLEKLLEKKQNCVIDNINVENASRLKWISICNKFSATPLLFYFDIKVEQALHNNIFRRLIGSNSPVTDLVIRTQNKNFVKPNVNEGFESIFKINFVPKFHNKDHEKLYFMYLSER